MNWFAIGNIADIPLRGARCVKTPQGKIAVFRTAENEVFAIEDHCPHKGGPLSQGIVHAKAVTCPLHNWVISLLLILKVSLMANPLKAALAKITTLNWAQNSSSKVSKMALSE